MVLYHPSDLVLFWPAQYIATRFISSCHLSVQKLSLAGFNAKSLCPAFRALQQFVDLLFQLIFPRYSTNINSLFRTGLLSTPWRHICALPTHCLFHAIPRTHMPVRVFTSSLRTQFKCPSFQTFLVIMNSYTSYPLLLDIFSVSYLFNQIVAEATIIYSLASSFGLSQ